MKRTRKTITLPGIHVNQGGAGSPQMVFNETGDVGVLRPFVENNKAYVVQRYGPDRKKLSSYKKIPVNNATLRYDEWRQLDMTVQGMARQALVGYDDLRSRGLVYNLNNPMATTVLTWQEVQGKLTAVVSIDPLRKGETGQPDHNTKHIPIPVIHADYQISMRLLMQSRKMGNGIDTTTAEFATRSINETLEDMLFGTAKILNYGGGQIYSYLTHPDVNEDLFESSGAYWDDPGATGADIQNDISDMIELAKDSFHRGPFMLYISSNYRKKMNQDYSTQYPKTIRTRLLEDNDLLDIKVVEKLPDDTVILVQMTNDVVDLIDGIPIQNVQWDEQGGFVSNYKVLTIQLPRVKSKLGQSGSTRYSGIVVRASQSYKL